LICNLPLLPTPTKPIFVIVDNTKHLSFKIKLSVFQYQLADTIKYLIFWLVNSFFLNFCPLNIVNISIVYYEYNHNLGGITGTSHLQLMDQKNSLFSMGKVVPSVDIKDESPRPETLITNHSKIFESTSSKIFPGKQEETRIQKARLIMGDDVKDLSDEDLEVFLTEFQYLIDCWLDEYERQVFNNKILKRNQFGYCLPVRSSFPSNIRLFGD